MSHRWPRALLALLLAGSASLALGAPAQQIDNDATLHRVEAVLTGDPGVSALRHTLVRDGLSRAALVPGTEDTSLDLEPALAIDPVRGTPVLAWSRDTGAGFDVYVSRFDEAAWTPAMRVLQGAADEVRPRILVSPSLVHVVARAGGEYVRISLDRVSLQPAFGPEPLPTTATPVAPGMTVTAPSTSTQLYFASDVLQPAPEDPRRVVIWGVRDEPVPIDYVEALALPPGSAEEPATAQAVPVEGRLTLTVVSESRLWYTHSRETTWAEFSSVDLEAVSLSDVLAMLPDLIRRAN